MLLIDCAGGRSGLHGTSDDPDDPVGGDQGGRAGKGGAATTGGAANGPGGGGSAGNTTTGGAPAGEGGESRGGAGNARTGGTSGAGEAGGGTSGDGPVSPGVRLTKLALYQSVEVKLMENGARVPVSATIVTGRPLLLRAWVDPDDEFLGSELVAELDVAESPGGLASRLRTTARVNGASDDALLASTVNVSVPAEFIAEGSEIAFRLRESGAQGTILAEWPESGRQALGAESPNGAFQVVLVPLVANGYSPELPLEIVESYRGYLERIYPVSDVSMSVRAAYELPVPVDADGDGWDEALEELYALRARDAPADNTYYYGVLAPAPTFDDYCPADCVLGLSVVASLGDVEYRGSIGTGYFEKPSDTSAPETLAHELGHALGRGHSTCGTDDADPFPYPGGGIGVRGWDGKRLLEPNVYKDVMGYCLPVWISDVNFTRFFARITTVNARASQAADGAPEAVTLRTLVVGRNGALRWGSERKGGFVVSGETRSVELLDPSGATLGVLRAPFRSFDHLPGGLVALPADALAGASAVRIGSSVLGVR